MFDKSRDVLKRELEVNMYTEEERIKICADIQALLKHLENLDKKAEYMKIGWNFDERYTDKYKYSIDIYDNDGQLSYEVDANTYEQALSEAVKSLEEKGEQK